MGDKENENQQNQDKEQNQEQSNKEGALTEDAAKKALLSEEESENKDAGKKPQPKKPVERDEKGTITDLGKVKTPEEEIAEQKDEDRGKGLEIGYKNMPMESLPSKGMYYPKDFKLSFRAASLEEIKHYSSMDENDFIDVNEKIASVLSTCIRVRHNDHQGSYEDLKEFDKIYMLFAIRDLSMLKHHRQNKISQEIDCPQCGIKIKREITNDVFGYYELDEKIMKYYDEGERGFVFRDDALGEPLRIYIPSIGTLKYITDYMREKEQEKRQGKGGFYDKQFLTFLQFLVKDWRELSEAYISQMYRDYKDPNKWSYDKHDLMVEISNRINLTIKPTIEMKCERGHISNPLVFFRGGYRSILQLSSVATRLLD